MAAMAAAEEWSDGWTVGDVLARLDGLCLALAESARCGDVAAAEQAASALASWKVPVRLSHREELAKANPAQALDRFAEGCRVEYYSQTCGRWVPAVVLGHNDDHLGSYRLNVHAAADPAKVRAATAPVADSAGAPPAAAPLAAPCSAGAAAGPSGASVAGDNGGRAMAQELPVARQSAGAMGDDGEDDSANPRSQADVAGQPRIGRRPTSMFDQEDTGLDKASVEASLMAATHAMRAFLPEARGTATTSPRTYLSRGSAALAEAVPPAQRLPLGAAAEYYSTTYGGWVPALVKGFDDQRGTYVLDIQPIALPDKVRPAAGHAPASGSHQRPPAAPERPVETEAAATAAPAAPEASAPPPAQALPPADATVSDTPGPPSSARAAPGAGRPRLPCGLCEAATPIDNLQGPECEHMFCAPCLRRHVLQAPHFLREPVTCPSCPTQLTRHQVRQVVGEDAFAAKQAEMSREDEELARRMAEELSRVEQQDSETRLQFRCPLCLEEGPADGAIELDCSHRLCTECFRNYLSSKISEAQVAEDELVCPIPDCKTEITVAQVEGATAGDPLWEKFLQFRMSIWRPGSGDDKIVACPATECIRFLVPHDAEFVQCPQCKLDFCARCLRGKHEGVTCAEFEVWQHENENVDKRFEELMRMEQWKRCPKCRAPSERESGCNFMQCRSSTCRKRTYWCYVCGKQLPKAEHYSHFPRGPYEDECLTPLEEHVQTVAVEPPSQQQQPGAEGIGSAMDAVMEAGSDIIDAFRGWLGAQQPGGRAAHAQPPDDLT